MKREENRHHLIPRSRRHNSVKTVGLPKGFHQGLHIVFGNLYGKEMELFVKGLNKMMDTKSSINGKDLEALRDTIKQYSIYNPERRK